MSLAQVVLVDELPDLLTPPRIGREWDWWQDALAGRPGKFEPLSPQFGYFRHRPRKSERGEPAAIWFDYGKWWCLIGERSVDDVAGAWRFAHGQPITEEAYNAALEGAPWPDEVAAKVESREVIGGNSGQPEELALDEIAAADAAFAAWFEQQGGVIRDEQANQVAKGYDDRIAKLRKDAEAARKAEKDEFLRQGQAIDERWRVVKAAAVEAEAKISVAVTPYRVERKRIADEAAKIEREARAAARAAGAPEPSRNVAKPATGLRKTESVVLDDPEALAIHLVKLKNAEVLDLLTKLGLRLLKAGAAAPGARLTTDYRA